MHHRWLPSRREGTRNLYLSSSSFSLLSLSSFSLCSLASRLFSASSLVASSGSVVPAEALGTAATATVDDGVETGAGSGAGAGVETGTAVQTGTKRKPDGTESQGTKPKTGIPHAPGPGFIILKEKGTSTTVCSHGFPVFCLSVAKQPETKTACVSEPSPGLVFTAVKSVNNIYQMCAGSLVSGSVGSFTLSKMKMRFSTCLL